MPEHHRIHDVEFAATDIARKACSSRAFHFLDPYGTVAAGWSHA